MKTMKAGVVLLSIWSGLNGLVAVAVTAMTLSGRTPPALSMRFTEPEIRNLDDRVVGVVNAQAALANPCIVALCLLVFVLTWKGVGRRARWAFWALASSLVPLQAFGFVSDGFLGHRNIAANIASTAILLTGLTLAGLDLFRQRGSD